MEKLFISLNQVKIAEIVKKVSLVFFFLFGGGHIISALMISNSYFLPYSSSINNILTIPFILSGLSYGFSSLSGSIREEKQSLVQKIFVIFTLLILLALIYIHFFIPDKSAPL